MPPAFRPFGKGKRNHKQLKPNTMKKDLHLKKTLRTILLVLLLSVAGMVEGFAQYENYHFSAICPSGQTLYYKITDETNRYVELSVPIGFLGGVPGEDPQIWYGYTKPQGNIVIPEHVRYGNLEYTVTAIGTTNGNYTSDLGGAFRECTGVISVEIPNSVTIIGAGAFDGCSNLNNVNIPNSVTTIEGDAFGGCVSLTSIIIGNSVKRIGNYAFSGCRGLTSVTFGDSIETIAPWAFGGCTGLTSVDIPNSVKSLSGFNNCTNLTSVIVGNSVETIGSDAFKNCSRLTHFSIPNSVETIWGNAFCNCTGLTSISIPNSVKYIKDGDYYSNNTGAFSGCSNLVSVSFGDSILQIGDCAFYGCAKLTSISIPNSVKTVGKRVFSNCNDLTTIVVGNSVKSIGENAFANNPRLNMVYYNAEKDVNAPNNVFSDCPNLTTIHIGADVKEIGSNIFKGCNTVHLVVALGPTPAVLDAGAFSDIVDNSVLMVSCGKKVTYFSVWNMFPFNNIIEDCGEYAVSMNSVGSGGNVTSSTANAKMGDVVTLTVNPNPGMHLASLIVCNASDPTQIIPITLVGKASSTYSFTMPPFGVVVMATFATGTSVDEINNSIPAVVYPNPTTGNVRIEASNLRHVSIFNVLGQQVYEGSADGDVFEYDMNSHEAGIYLVRIETTSGIVTKRVVLTK